MSSYKINKVANPYYDLYNIAFDSGVNHYYYEKKDNQFVNKVYIIIGELNIPNLLLEHDIYTFYKDLNGIPELIEVINNEFSNLEFIFVTNEKKYSESLKNIIAKLNNNSKIIDLKEYLKRHDLIKHKSVSHNPQYDDYDPKNNVYISKNQEEVLDQDINLDKEYIQYNGYNERLINDNVKNIVNIKKSSGGKNEL